MRIPRVCSLLTWYGKIRRWCYSYPQGSPFSWSPPWLVCARYRRHQASQHGGAHRGDHSGRVPPPSLQHLRVQQQQRDNPAVWHAGVGPVWQAHQMWVASSPGLVAGMGHWPLTCGRRRGRAWRGLISFPTSDTLGVKKLHVLAWPGSQFHVWCFDKEETSRPVPQTLASGCGIQRWTRHGPCHVTLWHDLNYVLRFLLLLWGEWTCRVEVGGGGTS